MGIIDRHPKHARRFKLKSLSLVLVDTETGKESPLELTGEPCEDFKELFGSWSMHRNLRAVHDANGKCIDHEPTGEYYVSIELGTHPEQFHKNRPHWDPEPWPED